MSSSIPLMRPFTFFRTTGNHTWIEGTHLQEIRHGKEKNHSAVAS